MAERLHLSDPNHPWHTVVRQLPGRDIGHGVFATHPVDIDKQRHPGAQVVFLSAHQAIGDKEGPGVYLVANLDAEELRNIAVRSLLGTIFMRHVVQTPGWGEKQLENPPGSVTVLGQLSGMPDEFTMDVGHGIILNHVGFWNGNVTFEVVPVGILETREQLDHLGQSGEEFVIHKI